MSKIIRIFAKPNGTDWMRRFFIIGFLLIAFNAFVGCDEVFNTPAGWDEVVSNNGNRAYSYTTEKGAVIYTDMEIVLVSEEGVFKNSDNSVEVRFIGKGGNAVVKKCDTYQTDESGRMCTIKDSELCKEVNDCIDNNGVVEFSTEGFSMTISKS